MVLNGWFDFLVPDFMTSQSPPIANAPTMTAPAVSADTGPSFWSQIPAMLTAGLNMFTTTQMLTHPQIAAALIRPAGVGGTNPYGIPSGLSLYPGVTPNQYQYPPGTKFDPYGRPLAPSQASMLPLIAIGGGGLLLIFLMMGKK